VSTEKGQGCTFAALDVPNADGLVKGAAHDEIGLRVEGAVEHV
jgi:hypothetical protein